MVMKFHMRFVRFNTTYDAVAFDVPSLNLESEMLTKKLKEKNMSKSKRYYIIHYYEIHVNTDLNQIGRATHTIGTVLRYTHA